MQLLKLQNWLLVTAASASFRSTSLAPEFQSDSAPSSDAQAGNIRVRRSLAESTTSSIFRQKRQRRCVKCYEDRRRHGEHSGSTADDGNWYLPRTTSYNRYHDRSRGGDRDYDRFYSYYDYNRERNKDYIPRTYDRYEERRYDRYDDRPGSYPAREQRRGYGYDAPAPYFGSDHYTDVITSDKFDVPAYERNYDNRYYSRNYRPQDDAYRGQSGVDSSGYGYYYPSNGENPPGLESSSRSQSPMRDPSLLPYGRPIVNPCHVQVSKCPYDENWASPGSLPSTATASYQTMYSGRHRGSGTSVSSTHTDGSGWNYLDEKKSDDEEIDRDRSTKGNQQSAADSRPRRPLGGNYLFDRKRSEGLGTATSDDDRVSAKPQVNKNAPENST